MAAPRIGAVRAMKMLLRVLTVAMAAWPFTGSPTTAVVK